MKMTQKSRGAGGFTLVEVIVVAVIVLILSAVAIPLYNGFVKQARQDAVDNLAETAAAAANSYWRKTGATVTGTINPNDDPLKLYFDVAKHTVNATTSCIEVKETLSDNPLSTKKPYTNETTCN